MRLAQKADTFSKPKLISSLVKQPCRAPTSIACFFVFIKGLHSLSSELKSTALNPGAVGMSYFSEQYNPSLIFGLLMGRFLNLMQSIKNLKGDHYLSKFLIIKFLLNQESFFEKITNFYM